MVRLISLHLLLLIGVCGFHTQAQLDSSSTVLLRSSGRAPSPENLDSNRYKVRAPESRPVRNASDEDPEIEEKAGEQIPAPITPPPQKPVALKKSTEATSAPTVISNETVVQNEPEPPKPSVPAQVKELLLGGSDQEIEDHHKRIHPQDPRQNVVMISFAPAYYYNDSDSHFSYRRYNSNGPGLGLGMNVWMTPFFGIQSKYFASVSGSQRSGDSMASTDLQSFEAGLRFRRHFGYSRKAAQLIWGIDYHDSQNKISKSSSDSFGRKSSGLSLALDVELPRSVTYSTTMGLEIRPRLQHKELNAGVEGESGTKNETNAVSFSLGGHWILDRQNQVFWKSYYSVERNLFEGSASLPDAATGNTPDGVSVTNSMLMFYFGFRWGS